MIKPKLHVKNYSPNSLSISRSNIHFWAIIIALVFQIIPFQLECSREHTTQNALLNENNLCWEETWESALPGLKIDTTNLYTENEVFPIIANAGTWKGNVQGIAELTSGPDKRLRIKSIVPPSFSEDARIAHSNLYLGEYTAAPPFFPLKGYRFHAKITGINFLPKSSSIPCVRQLLVTIPVYDTTISFHSTFRYSIEIPDSPPDYSIPINDNEQTMFTIAAFDSNSTLPDSIIIDRDLYSDFISKFGTAVPYPMHAGGLQIEANIWANASSGEEYSIEAYFDDISICR